jgi:preprotein translocase subunit SecG
MLLLLATRLTNPAISNRLGNFTSPTAGGGALSLIITNLMSVGFGLGGFIFFAMIIRGGYAYMTAGGDKEGVQRATKTLTTAFIGISILFSVYAILTVVQTLFGINLRIFSIPNL